MSDDAEPTIPLTQEEFEHEVHVQLLRLNSRDTKTTEIADKVARLLVEYLWHSGVRPTQLVSADPNNSRARVAGGGWKRMHQGEPAPLFAEFANEGPIGFTQPPVVRD